MTIQILRYPHRISWLSLFLIGEATAFKLAYTTRLSHHRHRVIISKDPSNLFPVRFMSTVDSVALTGDVDYGASQITVLSGLDPVRKRPGMYIGSTGPDGLHQLMWEVVDNSIDEALAGHAKLIQTVLNQDGSCTVIDDGRGIPTDIHPITGVSALETVLTVLHAGGKFENDSGRSGYKVSGGLHGVGISVVNALSSWVEVKVQRKMKEYFMRFERGLATGPLKIHDDPPIHTQHDSIDKYVVSNLNNEDGEQEDWENNPGRLRWIQEKVDMVQQLKASKKSGTEVTFLPDIQVFKGENGKPSISFDSIRLKARMDELAFLNPGLVLTLQDKTAHGNGSIEIFYHAGGLQEYVEMLCNTKTPLFGEKDKTKFTKETKFKSGKIKRMDRNQNDPVDGLLSEDGGTIVINGNVDTSEAPPVSVTAALRWSSDMYTETILSFTNNIRTRDGGSHVDGLKTSLTRAVNVAAKRLGKLKEGQSNLPGEFIREGLTAIISVSVIEPEFEGQTK